MRNNKENMEYTMPILQVKEEINEELDYYKIDDLSNYIVHELDSFKIDLDIHKYNELDVHKVEELSIHKVGESGVRKIGELDVHKVRKLDVGNVVELDIHKIKELDVYKNDEFNVHKVYELETHELNDSENHTENNMIDIRKLIMGCELIDTDITELNIKQEMISTVDEDKSEPTSLMHRCFKCGLDFGNFSTFAQHQLLHASSRSLFCNDCVFGCRTKQDMILHIQQNHLKSVSKSNVVDQSCGTKCTVCKNTFKNAGSLSKHSKRCEKKCKIKKKIKEKEPSHFTKNDNKKKYVSNTKKTKKYKMKQLKKCNDCEFVTFKKYTMDRHILTHTDLHPFGCDQCSYSCNTSYQLRRHIETIHLNIKKKTKKTEKKVAPHQYICETCGASFAQCTNLKSHMLTHKRGDFFFCKKCDYACRSRKAFKRHNDIHAGIEVKKHFCSLCSYCSYDSRHVRRHQVVHTRGGPKRRTKKTS